MNVLNETINLLGLHEAPELATEDVRRRIFQYCVLLWKKNEQLNLTRHTNFDQFVSRDLADTLQLSKLIPHNLEVLDVGSGGGVPGMLLAIIRPDLMVTLTDSTGKKAKALEEFAAALDLDVAIYHQRAENLLDDFRFDVTIARAVGPLFKICGWFSGRWPAAGRLLAIKGPQWTQERLEAKEKGLLQHVDLRKISEYPTPGTTWNSVILELKARQSD